MNRRNFFKFICAIASIPAIAPLVALCAKQSEPQRIKDALDEFSLTRNDDLFGTDRYLLERTHADVPAARAGVRDHLNSGLSMYSPEDARMRAERDIAEKTYGVNHRTTNLPESFGSRYAKGEQFAPETASAFDQTFYCEREL